MESVWISRHQKILLVVIRNDLTVVAQGMNLDLCPTLPAEQALAAFRAVHDIRHHTPVLRGLMKDISRPEPKDDVGRMIVRVGVSGDMEAFEQIFRAYAPRVRAFMMQRVRDPQISEELMQETMVMIWRKAAQFDPVKGSPGAWIFTIARNLRIDSYRRSRQPDFDPNDPAFVPEAGPAADDFVETQDQEQRLHAALTGLPAEQHDLLKLAFFEEVSHSEIAARLGLPLGTVKSRIRLAFSKLRAALGDRS